MKSVPLNPSASTRARNPHLYPSAAGEFMTKLEAAKPVTSEPKALMNETEARYMAIMVDRGCAGILAQSITLRLDPPFRSYRPDFFYITNYGGIRFVEVKGPHRFRRAGIAKVALASKTYPQFTFELAEWDGKQWKETVL